jgi:hypothetical protein
VIAFDRSGNANHAIRRRRIKSPLCADGQRAVSQLIMRRVAFAGNGVSDLQLHLNKLVQNNQILCKGKVVFKKLRCVITLGLKSVQRPINIKSLFLSADADIHITRSPHRTVCISILCACSELNDPRGETAPTSMYAFMSHYAS